MTGPVDRALSAGPVPAYGRPRQTGSVAGRHRPCHRPADKPRQSLRRVWGRLWPGGSSPNKHANEQTKEANKQIRKQTNNQHNNQTHTHTHTHTHAHTHTHTHTHTHMHTHTDKHVYMHIFVYMHMQQQTTHADTHMQDRTRPAAKQRVGTLACTSDSLRRATLRPEMFPSEACSSCPRLCTLCFILRRSKKLAVDPLSRLPPRTVSDRIPVRRC